MVYLMKEFLALQRIGNVRVEDIKELDIEELIVNVVVLRLLEEKLDANEWVTLNLLLP